MEDDLISRSALWSVLGNIVTSEEVETAIANAPAVDAVPVVYCRECRHWRVGLDRTNTWCALLNGMETVEPDYCSFGKRRDNDGASQA